MNNGIFGFTAPQKYGQVFGTFSDSIKAPVNGTSYSLRHRAPGKTILVQPIFTCLIDELGFIAGEKYYWTPVEHGTVRGADFISERNNIVFAFYFAPFICHFTTGVATAFNNTNWALNLGIVSRYNEGLNNFSFGLSVSNLRIWTSDFRQLALSTIYYFPNMFGNYPYSFSIILKAKIDTNGFKAGDEVTIRGYTINQSSLGNKIDTDRIIVKSWGSAVNAINPAGTSTTLTTANWLIGIRYSG